LCDVGSSNGTFVDGDKISELPLVPGEAVEVEFGDGGPRVRLWVGDTQVHQIPEPTGGPRPLSDLLAQARSEASDEGGGLVGAVTYLKALSVLLVTRSTTRLRVSVGIVVAVIVGAIVAYLLWQSAVRDDQLERDRKNDERAAWLERDGKVRERGGGVAAPTIGADIAALSAPAVFQLVVVEVPDPDGGIPPASTGTWSCMGFAVGDHAIATAGNCAVDIEDHLAEGLAVIALSGGTEIAIIDVARHGAADVALLRPASPCPQSVELEGEIDAEEVRVGTNLFVSWAPTLGDKQTELAFGPASRVDAAEQVLGHNLGLPATTRGAPIFLASGKVVAIAGAGPAQPLQNFAIRIRALRELIGENTWADGRESMDGGAAQE
jgi:hypothetical protein